MSAIQSDTERSISMYFQLKQSVNRAVHAAAQQIDLNELSYGKMRIDEKEAERVAKFYLQQNLNLDQQMNPLPGSMMRNQAQIVHFQVVNEGTEFPYLFEDSRWSESIQVTRPAVIMILRIEYPRLYRILPPITWHVKGVAELVLPKD